MIVDNITVYVKPKLKEFYSLDCIIFTYYKFISGVALENFGRPHLILGSCWVQVGFMYCLCLYCVLCTDANQMSLLWDNNVWPEVMLSYHEETVVFRFSPQVFEDDLLHELLHQVPVLHHSMTDRPLQPQPQTHSFEMSFPQNLLPLLRLNHRRIKTQKGLKGRLQWVKTFTLALIVMVWAWQEN